MIVLGLLLAFVSSSLRYVFERTLPPHGAWDWLTLWLAGELLLMILVALVYCTLVFRVTQTTQIPVTEAVVDLFLRSDYGDAVFTLSKGIRMAIEENRAVSDRKIVLLMRVFKLTVWCFISSFLLAVALGGSIWGSARR